jgi:hypothetical protein
MPVTQTSCPAVGSARALATAPLTQGNQQTIVYAANEHATDSYTATAGMLKRYDVTTGHTTSIVRIPNMGIGGAEVSPNGQWILFTSASSVVDPGAHQNFKLQAVRIDGRGLQTLYCGTSASNITINDFQWSPDQTFIAFNSDSLFANSATGTNTYTVQLLNVATGNLHTAFSFSTPYATGMQFHSWLDSSHLYLYQSGPGGLFSHIYLLNTSKGANQHENDLTTIVNTGYNGFESSYDRSQLYIDYNGCGQMGCMPPSSITTLPATGGTSQTLWQSTQSSMRGERSSVAGKN